MEHTALPWTISGTHVDRGNIQIGSPEDYIGEVYTNYAEINQLKIDRANAEFIVKACNSHYELLEACQLVYRNLLPTYSSDHLCMKKLKQAISKA